MLSANNTFSVNRSACCLSTTQKAYTIMNVFAKWTRLLSTWNTCHRPTRHRSLDRCHCRCRCHTWRVRLATVVATSHSLTMRRRLPSLLASFAVTSCASSVGFETMSSPAEEERWDSMRTHRTGPL